MRLKSVADLLCVALLDDFGLMFIARVCRPARKPAPVAAFVDGPGEAVNSEESPSTLLLQGVRALIGRPSIGDGLLWCGCSATISCKSSWMCTRCSLASRSRGVCDPATLSGASTTVRGLRAVPCCIVPC